MSYTDCRGVETSATSQAAVDAYDAGLELFLNYESSAGGAIKQVLADHPESVMATVLRGYMMMMLETTAVHAKVAATAATGLESAAYANDRERLHLAALREWAGGDVFAAAANWDRILADHPRDLLALKMHHYTTFWTGRSGVLLSAVAGVIEAWSETTPGFDHVLGMHAFGLNETGSFAQAEEVGRQAVELNPEDLWSIHAVAHALEMQGALDAGDKWFDVEPDRWATKNPFAGHIWWHAALFPWNRGDYDRVLELYDQRLRPASTTFFLDLQNLSSLLMRLDLAGVDVGDRWDELGEYAADRIGDHVLAFTDAHCAMTLCRTGRTADLDWFLRSIVEQRELVPASRNTAGIDTAVELCRGFVYHSAGELERASDAMLRANGTLWTIGGSHAQRDLFDLVAADTAERAGALDAAVAIWRRRTDRWPNSVPGLTRHAQLLDNYGGRDADARDLRRRAAEVAS